MSEDVEVKVKIGGVPVEFLPAWPDKPCLLAVSDITAVRLIAAGVGKLVWAPSKPWPPGVFPEAPAAGLSKEEGLVAKVKAAIEEATLVPPVEPGQPQQGSGDYVRLGISNGTIYIDGEALPISYAHARKDK